MRRDDLSLKKIILTAAAAGILCLSLASCSSSDNRDRTASDAGSSDTDDPNADTSNTDIPDESTPKAAGHGADDWENDPIIGKVQPGYYKLNGIVKDNETFEEMREMQSIKAYLLVRDDGSASLDLDGEKTEYFYDKYNFYLCEDTERKNGIPYVYIGGRLVLNDGSSVSQYMRLSDEEAASEIESGDLKF